MSNTNVLVIFNELFLPKNVVTSGISLSTDASNIFISAAYFTTILNSIGGVTLVSNSVGPNLGVKNIIGGLNIEALSTTTTIFLNSTNVSLTSLGGMTLVGTSAGPALSIRGIAGGTNVTIVSSNTTLQINSTAGNALACGKFVISQFNIAANVSPIMLEARYAFRKVASDSTSGVNNAPRTYRIYNNTGATRIFRVDADMTFETANANRTLTFGLYTTSESTASLNTDYQCSVLFGLVTFSRSAHIARNATMANNEYISLWVRAPTSGAFSRMEGVSITLNTID